MTCAVFIYILVHITVVQTALVTLIVPRTLWAVYGTCAEIPCTFDYGARYQNPRGMWSKGGSDRLEPGVSIIYEMGKLSKSYGGRIQFTGNIMQKECSLRINDVRNLDEYCFTLSLENLDGRVVRKSHGCVTVSILHSPSISVPRHLVAGRVSNLICSLNHSCPSAQLKLKWIPAEYLQAKILGSKGNEETVQGPGKASSNFTFTPSLEDDGKIIGCKIISEGSMVQAFVALDIQYHPMNMSGPSCRRYENWINCICWAKAKPRANITWRIDGKVVPGYSKDSQVTDWALENLVVQSSLTISPQAGAGRIISCVAVNVHGTNSSTYLLKSSGSFPREVVISASIAAMMVIVVLIAVVAYRKKRRIAVVDSQTDEHSGQDVHGPTVVGRHTSSPSPQGDVMYAAISVSNLRQNEMRRFQEKSSEYAPIKFK